MTRAPLPPPFGPLTSEQVSSLRELFARKRRSPKDADQLVADWRRLAYVGFGQAAVAHASRQRRRPNAREKVQAFRALSKAMKCRAIAAQNVVEMRKQSFGLLKVQEELACREFVRTAVLALNEIKKQHADAWKRLLAQPAFSQRAKSGTPRWLPETALLEVLAAYFRKHQWPVTQAQDGLFASTAYVVLANRASMNVARLRHLAEYALSYDDLADQVADPQLT